MRRSICYSEPKAAIAGMVSNWKFIYTSENSLSKGTTLKFDLASHGEEIDWEIPVVGSKKKSNFIWMELSDGKILNGKLVDPKDPKCSIFEFLLPQEVGAGESFAIMLGAFGKEKGGNGAQQFVQRRKPFYLHIEPKSKKESKEVEEFYVDIKGGKLSSIRILVPSSVNKNQRFDVVVRFEDQFGNLTGNAPEGTLIELSYQKLRENISWKLFVPETGFITLPNLYFNEEGIYKINLKNLSTNEEFVSSPIKCFGSNPESLFWGVFHGETKLYNTPEDIESSLRYMRDDQAMQFFGVSPIEDEKVTSNDLWKKVSSFVAEFNEEDRFSSFLGFQWNGEAGTEGLRTLVYAKDNKPLLRFKDSKSNQLKKIYKSHTPNEIISIPSFTMGSNVKYDFKNFDAEYEPVVEIYNAWGSSECLEKEGNLRPIKGKGKKGVQENKDGSIRRALKQNHRFGFTAGGVDNRGVFAELKEAGQTQYSPGITAVLSKNHTRDAIFAALQKKACFATTGARIILGFEIAKHPMGSELSTEDKPGLVFNRHITGFVAGVSDLKEVTLFRNGDVFHTFECKGDELEFTFDDDENIKNLVIKSPDDRAPFIFYYLRVVQKDGHIAWSTPIWIDLVKVKAQAPIKKKIKAKK